MFFNVVGAYTYKNYTDAVTWLFMLACLGARINTNLKKMPLVNSVQYQSDIKLQTVFCCSMHTPCDLAFVTKIHLATYKSI